MREKLIEVKRILGMCVKQGISSECKGCPYIKSKSTCLDALMEDALAVINHLERKDSVQKWIPVSERLPEKITNKVITLSQNGYVGFGHYENYKGKQTWYNLESDMPFTDWNHDDNDSYEVTHWMPLPEAPKGE